MHSFSHGLSAGLLFNLPHNA